MTDQPSNTPQPELVKRVAKSIAPIRHRYADFGLKRCRVMAIDYEIAAGALAAIPTTESASSVPVVEACIEASKCAVSADAIACLEIRSPLNRTIFKVMQDYRLSNMVDEEGYPYPLVDALSSPAPADIGTGEMELVAIADAVEEALSATHPQPVQGVAEVLDLDWLMVAHSAGNNGISYRTNAALKAFLADILPTTNHAQQARSEALEEAAKVAEQFNNWSYVTKAGDAWEPGSPYDRGQQAAAKAICQSIRALSGQGGAE